jgi:hypothetical protein
MEPLEGLQGVQVSKIGHAKRDTRVLYMFENSCPVVRHTAAWNVSNFVKNNRGIEPEKTLINDSSKPQYGILEFCSAVKSFPALIFACQ